MSDLQDESVILDRREKVARLYLQGWTQMRIGRELACSQATVSGDLKAVREWWRESATMALGERIALELSRIDRIEAEAWDAWERSKAERIQSFAETDTAGPDGQPPEGTEADRRQRQRTTRKKSGIRKQQVTGEDRYLSIVLDCVQRRCKILGLDAPDKLNLTGTQFQMDVDPKNLTDDELINIERIANRLAIGQAPDAGSHPG